MAREQTLHEAAQPASGAKGSVAGGAPAERSRVARRVTLVGIAANLTLALMQVVIGWLGRSQALVADGVHTLSDLTTDVIVLLAVGKGAKAADEEHPYGHSRFETLATAAVGFILIAVALGLSINAGRRLMDPEHLAVPAAYTLIAVIMTILTKEGLYRYAMRAAREHRSNLLRANAWHYRSDAISSVVVLLGIGGSLVGFRYLDAVAAVGVAMMIAKIGWDLAWEALQELVDKGLSAEEREAIRATIMAVDGAKDMHLLRTRRMGGQALVDVHIQVDGAISVSEGHHISEMVRHLLIEQHESITDVTVHIDPEDDEITPSSLGLPLRNEVLHELERRFEGIDGAQHIDEVTLHYLGGRIRVELLLPFEAAPSEDQRRRLGRALGMAVSGADSPLREVVSSVETRYH